MRNQSSSHPCRRHCSARLMTTDEAAISAVAPRYAHWAYRGRLASAGPCDFIAGKRQGWKLVITGPALEVVPFSTLRQRVRPRTSSTNSPHPNSPSHLCASRSDSPPFFHVCRCECRRAAEAERWSRREVTAIFQWLLQRAEAPLLRSARPRHAVDAPRCVHRVLLADVVPVVDVRYGQSM